MNDTKIPHVSKIHPKNDFKHTLLCFWSLNFFVFCFTFSVIIFCRGLGTTEYICATYTTVLFASAFILFRCDETPFMFASVNHRVLLKFQKQTNIVILNPWMSLLNLTFNLKIFFFQGRSGKHNYKHHLLLQQKLLHFVDAFHQYVMDRVSSSLHILI